ncbi:hypothetical protein POX_d05927 [Penicillium oxalicum]|uniref:Uncharacterized protein n=1 Tax=Penicillium oxalicum (strain 114-2 / CGMCC 5302) TaxID=933388 RepID=S8AZL4_PENO1|nr:hypothetical protein POX_d05927 [Penicillium oxalicum]EPS31883.1 hypothetical protein PDE_06841 [Penicillium oxalicum 114-2]KAI2790415.1 hypothetical protein POX_d05927 [Penicillium oxalicum]
MHSRLHNLQDGVLGDPIMVGGPSLSQRDPLSCTNRPLVLWRSWTPAWSSPTNNKAELIQDIGEIPK